MLLSLKQAVTSLASRYPLYRALPPGTLRSYAGLKYYAQNGSHEDIARFVKSSNGTSTRYFSTSIVAAKALFRAGYDDHLDDILETLLDRFPFDARLHELISDVHAFHSRDEEALRSAERARTLMPSSGGAVARVVRLSYLVHGTERADEIAVTALRCSPRSRTVRRAVCRACTTPEQFGRIMAAWEATRKGQDDLVGAVRTLATAAARSGEIDAAIELYRDALRILAKTGQPAPTHRQRTLAGRGPWNAIVDVASALDAAGIPFFFAAGTALGLVREGRPIGADGDIDVGIFDQHWDREQLLDLFRGDPRFILADAHPYAKKIWLEHRGGSPVDLFRFYEEDGRIWHDAVFVRWHNTPFTVERREIRGVNLPLPAPVDNYLTENYGKWRTPNPGFDAFTEDAPNVEVIWPEYATLHYIRRAYMQWANGTKAGVRRELERAGETKLLEEIGLRG